MNKDTDSEDLAKRFKAMKKELGLRNADIAAITGHTPDSIKAMSSSKTSSRWIRLVVHVYEISKK